MKFKTILAFLPLAALSASATLTVEDLNENFSFHSDGETGAFSVSWTPRLGRTYFVQYSYDLLSWSYFPLIEQGNEDPIIYGFTYTGGNRFFSRLRVTDLPSTDPFTADFDGDGISNYDELLLGTSPFDANPALVIGGDDDSDGVFNEQDAAPGDANVGQLSISISYPAHNSPLY